MRFNYLSDTPPDIVERLRSIHAKPHLRLPLAACLTVLVIITAWSQLERRWVERALQEDRAATLRLQQARDELSALNLARGDTERLLNIDRRLRAVRTSGLKIAAGLARVANALPAGAWLTELSRAKGGGFVLRGRARDVDVLTRAATAFSLRTSGARNASVRATRSDENDTALVDFTVRVPE